MNLLTVLVPDPKYFFIICDNGERISIEKYANINIDFSQRIAFVRGDRKVILSPLITYYVKIDSANKEKFKFIFKNAGSLASSILHTTDVDLQLGREEYRFKADITARPDGRTYHLFAIANTINDHVRIELKLEDTNISLFASAEDTKDAYEEYCSRFELLDL